MSLYNARLAFFRAAAGLVALSAGLHGQAVESPVLGYVFDSAAHGIRPLWGVPGAATLGDPLEPNTDVRAAAVSPRQNYVLMLTGPDRDAALFLPKTGASQKLPGVPSGASRIVLSPEGDSAAFYFPADHQLLLIIGLPDAPSAPTVTKVPDEFAAEAPLAISDDGTIVLSASNTPEATVISSRAPQRRVALSGPASAVAFLSRSHAAVFTTATGAVLESNLSTASIQRSIATSDLSGFTAVAASADGRSFLLTNSQSGKITIMSLGESDTSATTLDCHCIPTGAVRINAAAAWQLTNYSGDPLPLLDMGSGSPRLVLVPPAPKGGNIP